MTMNKVYHQRVQKRGDLGRLSWTTTKGKDKLIVRAVTVYCPHNTGGPESVYAQYRLYFNTQDDDGEPRTAFWDDLCKAVTIWLREGNQLIIGGDFNQDTSTITQFNQFSMRDALRQRHNSTTEELRGTPPTYNRGATTLDTIFGTPSLVCTYGGYLEYGQVCLSDHRSPWLDFTYQVAFGNSLPAVVRAPARRHK
jgi:hypothetical protein